MGDELSDLATSFNSMKENLREMYIKFLKRQSSWHIF